MFLHLPKSREQAPVAQTAPTSLQLGGALSIGQVVVCLQACHASGINHYFSTNKLVPTLITVCWSTAVLDRQHCSARPTALPLCYLVLFFTDNFVTINTNPTNRPLPRCHHFRRICPRVSVNLSFWVTVIGRPARYSVIASQSVDVASECGEPSSDKNAPSAGNYSIDHAKYVRVHIFQSSIH